MFHWQPDYALRMPATRFFALLREGNKLKEIERTVMLSEMCDVTSIALGDAKYYTHLKTAYRTRLEQVVGNAPKISFAETPEKPKTEPIAADSMKANTAMMGLFRSAKGSH
jgi:hypothetical protein